MLGAPDQEQDPQTAPASATAMSSAPLSHQGLGVSHPHLPARGRNTDRAALDVAKGLSACSASDPPFWAASVSLSC